MTVLNNKQGQIMRQYFAELLGVAILMGISGSVNADPMSECWVGNGKQEAELCLGAVEDKANAALDDILRRAMDAANKFDDQTAPRRDVVPALNAAQEAWTKYRDKHCEYVEANWGGGSGTGMAISNCRIELARKRFDELTEFIQTAQ